MKTISVIIFVLTLTSRIITKTKEEWKSRTIYQVLIDRIWRSDDSTAACPNLSKYCGGTFKGLMNKLDYIKGMGFDAIWISPVVENTKDGYHGYWALNFNKINSFYGTEEEFKTLIDKMHEMDMWLMVDIVANHIGYPDPAEDFSKFVPFNKPEHYHTKCDIHDEDFDHNQWRVENCRYAGLPDLKQQDPWVRQQLLDWIKNLVQKWNIDGLRIDTLIHMPKEFWKEFTEVSGVYTIGENLNKRTDYVGGYIGYTTAVLNYPLYFTLKKVFNMGESPYNIRNQLQLIDNYFPEIDYEGLFVDNHDMLRFLCVNPKVNRLRNALAYILFARGIPIVYYGTEQEFNGCKDPENREVLWTKMDNTSKMYKFLQSMITYRKKLKIWDEKYIEIDISDTWYIYTRGDALIATTISEDAQKASISFLDFKDGTEMCNILDEKDCIKITNGKTSIQFVGGEPKVYVLKSLVNFNNFEVDL